MEVSPNPLLSVQKNTSPGWGCGWVGDCAALERPCSVLSDPHLIKGRRLCIGLGNYWNYNIVTCDSLKVASQYPKLCCPDGSPEWGGQTASYSRRQWKTIKAARSNGASFKSPCQILFLGVSSLGDSLTLGKALLPSAFLEKDYKTTHLSLLSFTKRINLTDLCGRAGSCLYR